ncbi:NAD(P)H-dependent oxidoreductase [Streptomyces oceani]|uniref:NAD(P)H-dependent oxidoreductase n=1 Tax=Streptomyces oceani TaxID=1075402 RepID=UPI0008733FB0|nr:NAD(P)H-dependent oxidoreductase [Streptomyces oceani]
MKVLWIFAHPERRSLNGALLDEGLRTLTDLGHEHQVSDLYAMRWKPVVDADDFHRESCERLFVGEAQERAYEEGKLSDDILAEQEKIAWADALVFHFPLWWLGPPAILKGWFDRVLVQGFAFGVRDGLGNARRYGDGGLAGKRALAVTTIGARASSFGPRGIHGQLEEVLFPLLHGTFWYTGMDPMPPLVVYGADRATRPEADRAKAMLRERVRELPGGEPIPYFPERGGAYDDALALQPHLAPDDTGVRVHSPGRVGAAGGTRGRERGQASSASSGSRSKTK